MLKQINDILAKEFEGKIELIKGEGYHYFVFDDGVSFETWSVMVCYTNQQTKLQWLEDGRYFAANMGL